MCQNAFFLLVLTIYLQMAYQQNLDKNEKLHKSLAGTELLANASSPAPSVAFSPSPVTFAPKAPPPRPRPRIRIVRPRRPRIRLVVARFSIFRFQCSAKNDTNESFCHSKCPNVHRWTAGVRAIPSLSRNCPNGCGLCGNSSICMDREPRCRLFHGFCRGPFYSHDWKRIYCGRTCGLC
uniref:ShKT domain-containing protein n=1 Tax=Globodera rostochiensis TaxID=31243 RepID=A0A914HUG5_GLORO